METKILEFRDYNKLKEIITSDGVIAFPTETVYGMGIRSDSFLACKKLFEAKHRPQEKKLTLMLYDKNDIEKYAYVNDLARKIIDAFMPGQITVILPKREECKLVGLENDIGIRIPDEQETLAMLQAIEIPMYVTSANISGQPSLLDFEEVYDVFNNKIEGIVKGKSGHNKPSSVVKIDDNGFTIIREGNISANDIEGVI